MAINFATGLPDISSWKISSINSGIGIQPAISVSTSDRPTALTSRGATRDFENRANGYARAQGTGAITHASHSVIGQEQSMSMRAETEPSNSHPAKRTTASNMNEVPESERKMRHMSSALPHPSGRGGGTLGGGRGGGNGGGTGGGGG